MTLKTESMSWISYFSHRNRPPSDRKSNTSSLEMPEPARLTPKRTKTSPHRELLRKHLAQAEVVFEYRLLPSDDQTTVRRLLKELELERRLFTRGETRWTKYYPSAEEEVA